MAKKAKKALASVPIVAITLSWESLDFLPRLIESTLTWADVFLILDTGSTDGSREYLIQVAKLDPRVIFSIVDTDVTTFKRGQCLNVLLAQIEELELVPEWIAVIDCDEVFEDDFVSLELPVIRELPRLFTEVTFERPNLWYSEDHARADGIHAGFRERPFQRYQVGFRYPASIHHMSRSMRRPVISFPGQSHLLHFGLRNPERSRLQYERLKMIDRDWPDLLRSPDAPPALRKLVPLSDRWSPPKQSLVGFAKVVTPQIWRKLASRVRRNSVCSRLARGFTRCGGIQHPDRCAIPSCNYEPER